jgi:hypothetical protein
MAILRDDELDRYGQAFLCELYRRARDIAGRRFDRYGVFRALGLGGISGDEGIHQATDEVVQSLRRQEWIQTYENNHDVSLTDRGLDRARQLCR